MALNCDISPFKFVLLCGISSQLPSLVRVKELQAGKGGGRGGGGGGGGEQEVVAAEPPPVDLQPAGQGEDDGREYLPSEVNKLL